MESIAAGDKDHTVVDEIASKADAAVSNKITPLLNEVEKPKINIFSISYP